MSSSGIPIISDVAKGVGEVFSRPGDIVNNPAKFFGSAASAAAPFLTGPLASALGTGGLIPGWAGGLMSTGGNIMANGGKMPGGYTGGLNPALAAAAFAGGGNVSDKGYGQKALDYADLIGNAGKGLLTTAQNGLPKLSDMGELSKLPGIIAQEARTAGVVDPFTGVDYGTNNPYAVQPYQQEMYNHTADMVNQGRQSSLSNLRQQLAARGIDDPRAIAAAEAQINAGHDQILANTHANLGAQAYTQRQATLNEFQNLIPALYGAQSGAQQQGYQNAFRMLTEPIQAYDTAAQRQIGMDMYNKANQGALWGNLLGYQQGLPGQPPIQKQERQPGQAPGSTGTPEGGFQTSEWVDPQTGNRYYMDSDGQYYIIDTQSGIPIPIDPWMMNTQDPFAEGYPTDSYNPQDSWTGQGSSLDIYNPFPHGAPTGLDDNVIDYGWLYGVG